MTEAVALRDRSRRTLVRARIAAAADFSAYGFALGVWVVHIPAIRDRTGMSLHDVGVVLLIFGLSSFAAMLASGRLVTRIGAKKLLVCGSAALSLSLVGPGLATSQLTLTFALVVLGLSAGFHDAGQNAHAIMVEQDYGRPIFNSLFALFSLGGITAAIFSAVARTIGADVSTTFVVSAGLSLVVTSIASFFLLGPSVPDLAARGTALRWTRRTLLLGSASFALLLAEGVAFDWSTIHLRDVLHANRTAAGAAFGVFSVTVTVVRLLADRVTHLVGPLLYLRVGCIVAMAGMLLVVVSPTIPWALVGWAVFGLGLAGCAGQIYSAAGAINPEASGAGLARVTAIGYVGLLAGPSLIGFLAPHVGLRTALLVPIVFCVYALVIAPFVTQEEREVFDVSSPT